MSHRTFIESSAATTAFWLNQYGGRFASIFRRCPPSMFWGQWLLHILMLGNGANKGSKASPYIQSLSVIADGCDLWTLVFSISQHFTHGKLYIFWTYVAIQLIRAYFKWNRIIVKKWPPVQKINYLFFSFFFVLYFDNLTSHRLPFFYFVFYFDNPTSHWYHVIDIFTPYNIRRTTCIHYI